MTLTLDEFERCGVSAAEFAAHIGVKYQTFAHWRQRRKDRKRAMGAEAPAQARVALMAPAHETEPRWVEAVVEAGGTASPHW
ncbi:MAG: hypothetical protein ACFUZC_12385 [Chthoniobacteraceae bacterium]